MTDLELVKKCAEAMGFRIVDYPGATAVFIHNKRQGETEYKPLTNDAQAMALVKKFSLRIDKFNDKAPWLVIYQDDIECDNHDLNRAIVECVAKISSSESPSTRPTRTR